MVGWLVGRALNRACPGPSAPACMGVEVGVASLNFCDHELATINFWSK